MLCVLHYLGQTQEEFVVLKVLMIHHSSLLQIEGEVGVSASGKLIGVAKTSARTTPPLTSN